MQAGFSKDSNILVPMEEVGGSSVEYDVQIDKDEEEVK